MRLKQNKKERFTASAADPAKTAGTWLNYRTPPHSCANRAKTGPNGYCSQATNPNDCWGECGPLEYVYEWLMGGVDAMLRIATGDLNIDTNLLWKWFLKILTIFFFFLFFGILYRFYRIISSVAG